MQVLGTTEYLNATNLYIGDNIITLNANVTGSATPSLNAGIEVSRGTGTTRQFLWNETSQYWYADTNFLVNGNITAGTYYTGGGTTYYINAATSNLNSLTLASTLTINTDNGYVLLNRSATNKYIGVDYRTANTEKWFVGLRENLSSDNYIIYNANTLTDVITLNVSTNAATFNGSSYFNSSNVYIGDNNVYTNVRLYSSAGTNALPATSGTTQNATALRLRGGDNAVLDFGLNSVNTWIQATDRSGLNNNYNILLNPNGGNVNVNSTSNLGYAFGVSGTGYFSGTLGVGVSANTKVQILGGTLTAGTQSSYALGIGNGSGYDLTLGTDSSYAYLQTWTGKPLQINAQGNNVLFPNTSTYIGLGSTTAPAYPITLPNNTFISFNNDSTNPFGIGGGDNAMTRIVMGAASGAGSTIQFGVGSNGTYSGFSSKMTLSSVGNLTNVGNTYVGGTMYDNANTAYYIKASGTSYLNNLVIGGTTLNNGYGANINFTQVPNGRFLTNNWHGANGSGNWPGSSYQSGLSDSQLGSLSMRGTTGYQAIRQSHWVPIDRTKSYKVSVWIRTVSGNPYNYLSFDQAGYDLSQPDNGGWGQPYFFSGVPSGAWTEYTMTIGPSGAGTGYTWNSYTKYVQLGWLSSYPYGGYSGVAEITGFRLEELNTTIAAGSEALGDFYANRFIDRNDNSYLLDPNNDSNLNTVKGVHFRVNSSNSDTINGSPWYGLGYNNVGGPFGGTQTQIGGYYGVRLKSANGFIELESPNYGGSGWYYSTFPTSISNQFRATSFYDYDNTAYYVDPNGTSNISYLQNGSVWINNGTQYNNYNENIRLFNAPNGVSVIAFGASGTSGTPTTSILGYSSYFEIRFGGGSQARFYNGYTEIYGSTRSPIFYDYDNTGYYIDSNGTSNIVAAYIGGHYYYTYNTSNILLRIAANSGDAGILMQNSGGSFKFQVYGNGSDYGFLNGNWASWDLRKNISNGNMYMNNDSTYYLNTNGTTNLNNLTTAGVISSPGIIGYSTRIDNAQRTSFVVGGSSGTFYPVVFSIGAGATVQQYGEFMIERGGYDDPGYSGIGFSTCNIRFSIKASGWGFGATYENLEGYYRTFNAMADWTQVSQSSHLIVWLRGATIYYLYNIVGSTGLVFSNPSGTSWTDSSGGTVFYTANPTTSISDRAGYNIVYEASMRVEGTLKSTGQVYGTQFLDVDNAGYYLDPASTSNLNAANVHGNWYYDSNQGVTVLGNGSVNGSAGIGLYVYSTGNNGAIMAFHKSGYYAVNMGLDSDNVLRIGGWSAAANRWQLDMSGNNYVPGSSRAPIFYDLDDTGYYNNPNGTSNSVYQIAISYGVNTGYYNQAVFLQNWNGAGYGGIGTYSTHGWRFDQVGGVGSPQGFAGAGDVQLWIGPYNTIRGASAYFNIWYDWDNSGYYVDPSGTTNMNYVIAQSTFRLDAANNTGHFAMNNPSTYWGLMGNVSANDWRLGYGGPTGAMVGWNLRWDNGSTVWFNSTMRGPQIWSDYHMGTDGTFVFRVGSGAGNTRHIDLGNSGGDPSAVGSQTGISSGARGDSQPYYLLWVRGPYSNGYSTHTRMVLGWHTGVEIGGYYGYGGTRFFDNDPYHGSDIFQVGVGDRNNRSLTSFYAPIMYDYNDGGYYMDPNSSSQLSYVMANNWFRAQGATGFYNNTYGIGIRMTDGSWVRNYGGAGYYSDTYMYSSNRHLTDTYYKTYSTRNMVGDYDQSGTATKSIWTIGDSWAGGNYYGLTYWYGSAWNIRNDHCIGIVENSTSGNNHIFSMGNGDAWHAGNLQANGTISAGGPIYWSGEAHAGFNGYVVDPWPGYRCDLKLGGTADGGLGVYYPLRCRSYIVTDDVYRIYSSYGGMYGYGASGNFNQVPLFRINDASSYCSWYSVGTKNGWAGITVQDIGGTNTSDMWNYGSGGWYQENNSGWVAYWSSGNTCMGIGTSYTLGGGYKITIQGYGWASGTWNNYSDIRAKENIVTVDNALDKVMQMRGVYFNFKENSLHVDTEKQVGVIAQEMELVLPEVVKYDAEGDTYSVAYGNISAVLIEAVKELATQNVNQQITINNLQSQIDEIKLLLKT